MTTVRSLISEARSTVRARTRRCTNPPPASRSRTAIDACDIRFIRIESVVVLAASVIKA
jgi:hypothetical protein